MPLIDLLRILGLTGTIAYALNQIQPLRHRALINCVVVMFLAIVVLMAFGFADWLQNIKVPRLL